MQRALSNNEVEEGGFDVESDGRELVLEQFSSLQSVLSHFIKTQFFKSRLYNQIIDGFYVIMRLPVHNDDLHRLMLFYYVQVFRDDIYIDFRCLFDGPYRLPTSNLKTITQLYDDHVIIPIECFACKKTSLYKKNEFAKCLYTRTSTINLFYCIYTRKYYCYGCRTFVSCKTCGNFVSDEYMATLSKCINCVHGRPNTVKLCSCHYHKDTYNKVYSCAVCSKYSCLYDTFVCDTSETICRSCISTSITYLPNERPFCIDSDAFIRFILFHHQNLDRVVLMPGEQRQVETVDDFKNRVRDVNAIYYQSAIEYINHCKLAIK
jgi:hypothetical protein